MNMSKHNNNVDTKNAPHKRAASLLNYYIKLSKKSKETIAKELKISPRKLRSWLCAERPINASVDDLVLVLGIESEEQENFIRAIEEAKTALQEIHAEQYAEKILKERGRLTRKSGATSQEDTNRKFSLVPAHKKGGRSLEEFFKLELPGKYLPDKEDKIEPKQNSHKRKNPPQLFLKPGHERSEDDSQDPFLGR